VGARAGRLFRPVIDFVTQSKSVLWTSSALATGQLLSITTALLTSRLLGPAGKGLVNAVTTWTQLLCWVSILGLGKAAQVRIASSSPHGSERGEAARVSLGNGLAFALVVGVPVALIGAVTVAHLVAGLAPGAGTLAVWAIVAMPISLMALIVSAVQIGLGRRHIFNLAQVASPAVTLVLTLVFVVVSHLTPGRLVAAFIIGAIVSLIAGAWGLPWGTAALELRTFRQDLKFGLRLHAADLLVLTSLRLDVLVMSALFPAVQIGLYGAANSALMPVLILTSGSSALLTAKVANMAASRDPDVPVLHLQAAAVLREARKYALVSLAGGVALAALSPVLVRVVLGSAYGPAVKLIWILMPGYVCLGFSAIVAAGAEGMRRPWVGVVGETASTILTLILLPVLLPRLGAEGAAIASTAAYGVAAVACAYGLVTISRRGRTHKAKEEAVV